MMHAVLVAAAVATGSIDSSLVVTTDWLAKHLRDPGVVVLQVDAGDSAYRAGHIPGARLLRYGSFIIDASGNSTELPTADSLRALFEAVGVSTNTHLVLVGAPLVVSRAFFTCDYIGLAHVSVLNGGMTQWTATGHALEQRTPAIARGKLVVTPHPEIVARSGWIVDRLGKPGMSLIDTRREDEYNGTATGVAGHIAGARQVDWQAFFRDPNEFALAGWSPTWQRLWRERVTPGDTVVAYCRVGHRSSATYFVSRLLGLPVKLYDGSYEEWSRLTLPVVKTATPLLQTTHEGSP